MELQYCFGDEGRAYYAKGHVPLDEFMAELCKEVGADDTILDEHPIHCWLRVCRDFQSESPILVSAIPGSLGSFKATWIQEIIGA